VYVTERVNGWQQSVAKLLSPSVLKMDAFPELNIKVDLEN